MTNHKIKLNEYAFFRYKDLELEERLSVNFLLTGVFLSSVALILGLAFGSPFWMNIPHIFVVIMCLALPFILKDNISGATVIALFVVGFLYFPFVYLTNAGNHGAAPVYFIMIIVYFSFYMKKKQLIRTVAGLIIYYLCIMTYTYLHPDIVIPYPDEISGFIDLCVAIAVVAIMMSVIAYTSFMGYQSERLKAESLLKELEDQNVELELLSITDTLTSAYLRRYFLSKLQEEIDFSKENGIPVYVMMLDVDFFKKVNDTYGHLYGDEVLKQIALATKENIRSFDILGRYGGEEFIVLLTNVDTTQACEIAERIRSSVENTNFRHGKPITISIGLTKYEVGDTVESLIQRADDNMYSAKEQGRNRVVSAFC